MKHQEDFNRPTTKEILGYCGVKEIPEKVNSSYLIGGINSGSFEWVFGGRTYKEVANTYQKLFENSDGGEIVLLPSKFRFPKDEINVSLKSLEGLAKADSAYVLRKIAGDENAKVPKRITQEFALTYKKFPRSFFRRAIERCDIENPPMGVYWARSDGHFSGFTFLDSVGGAEMELMREKGIFNGKVIDPNPYAGSFRVKVDSGTENGVEHKVNLARLPIHRWGSEEQYYSWLDMEQTSTDDNTFFVGEAHKKRKKTLTIWSRPAVFAFYVGADFIKQHPEFKVHYRMNPFCIPQDESVMKMIDSLRFRSLIFHEENKKGKKMLTLHPLNKAEMNKVIGAITIDRNYNNMWFHWGKRDLSYLFTHS